MKLVAAMLVTALLASSCVSPVVTCGPVERRHCEEEARTIITIVERDSPGRRVVSITFLNDDGHARVILDDGREIGWGERL